jgi:DNA-binding NarL/FixJ family response regulator
MDKIKVILSDPQVLFREGIHFILSGEEDFEVTGETTSNEEAYSLIENNPPNVAILSMIGKTSGPEIARRIKRSLPSVAVILTMDNCDDNTMFAAVKSGASTCLTKDVDPENLLNTIRLIAKGSQPITDVLLTPSLAARILTEFADLAILSEQLGNQLAKLTPKESEILNTIAGGSKIAQIVAKLGVTEEAVRHHLTAVLNKLVSNEQAKSLIEAAQRSLSSIMRSGVPNNNHASDYVTKTEFNEFKEGLLEHYKSFIVKAHE